MKLSRSLYKAARLSRDVEALSSDDPKRVGRRIKNKALGRSLGPLWRLLWK